MSATPSSPKQQDRSLRFAVDGRVLLMALLAGLAIAGLGFGVDRMVHKADRLYASDAYTLVVACTLSYFLLEYERRRRQVLLRRMQTAAEVNHHIRNALTAVVYSAAVQSDAQLHEVLQDATARIDWVLTEVLPEGEASLRWPIQVPNWRPKHAHISQRRWRKQGDTPQT